ncbi:MAG: TIGR00730 family Rossman fold protein [Flavobacteriaceae bacterium]
MEDEQPNIKNWVGIKANDSWALFKIMSEFVNGYETLSAIGPCVSIFGSARTKADTPHYELAVSIAKAITENGYGIITGGGPGIMEAANKGAQLAKGVSVGLNINLPFEQNINPYIDIDKQMTFEYFFVRKVMFVKYAQGFIVLPGGIGTLDELFEAFTLIQTEKIQRFPIILVGSEYWRDLIEWIKNTLLKEKYISEEDLDLIEVVDTAEEVVTSLSNFHKKGLYRPNF